MALTQSEIEELEENQAEYGLTDVELTQVKRARALYNPFANPKGEACPVCNDPECIKGLATIDEGNKIHQEDHPEFANEKARENQRTY